MSEENVGGIYYTVEARTAALLTAERQVTTSTGRMANSFDVVEESVSDVNASFGKLNTVAAAVMAALSGNLILEYANAWTELSNKLVNSVKELEGAVKANETLADVTERVYNIAQDSRAELAATATLYSRLEKATRSYGVSAEKIAEISTTINKAFIVSGSNAEEASGAIRQLSQGLAAGALRGDEFNSVMESGPRLAQALADSLGVDVGQLRQMAAQGKLTTQVIVDGLLKEGTAVAAEFENTTLTMDQALTRANNSITKFIGESTTVQSGISGINKSIEIVAENLDTMAYVIAGVASIIGGRYIAALTLAAKETINTAISNRALVIAEKEAANSAVYAANATLRRAVADKSAAASAVALAQAEYNLARGSLAEATALDNLIATRSAETAVTLTAIEAKNALAVAESRAAAAAKAASTGVNLARKALSLIGGPMGAAMLAGTAIFYFYQKAQEAREEANKLADSVNELTGKFKDMSNTELAAKIGELTLSIPELTDAVAESKNEYTEAASKVSALERELALYGGRADNAERITSRLTAAKAEFAIASYNLEKAENRLSQTQNAVNMGQTTLNGTMKQGIDLLRRDSEETSIAAGMMDRLGHALDFASKSKVKFNAMSLNVERSADADKLLKQLEDGNALLAITDKRERAIAEARQKALAAGAAENSNQLRQIEEQAARNYDLLESERQKNAAVKGSIKVESQAAQAEKRRLKTLQDLSNEMAIAELKARGLNKEAAQLAAEQELGAGASSAQIQAARSQAEQIFNIQQAAEDKKVALERDSVAQSNQARDSELAQLQRQLDAGVVSFKQAEQRKAEIAADYTKKIAEASAASVVSPQMEMAGTVDPIQLAANEYARKLALVQAYESAGVLTHNQALALKNAADTQYEQQRLAAIEQQYRAQSELNDFTMSMIDTVGQRGANMVTGLVTGTQTLTEAARNLAATILNQAVGALAQMGIQAMKNAVIGEAASSAAVAQAAITGPAIAAAYAPAASMVSLATAGANAIAAQAGIASTMGMTKMLSLSGGRRYGGGVSAGNMYRVNENGESEVFQNSAGQQMFIPGQSGKVVPADGSSSAPINVIINNSAPGATVESQGYNPDTRTIMLAVKEVAKQLRNRSGDISRSLSDSWNVSGKTK